MRGSGGPFESVDGAARNGQLLLVDDEIDNLDLLEGMLAKTNYGLTRCQTGREAIALLKAAPDKFDAILLDRMMPEMDGVSVLRQIKHDAALSSIPVILQTAAGTAMQVSEGLAAGAHYYLVKPFERSQLLPIIHGAVRSHQTMRELRQRLLRTNPLGLIQSGRFCFQTLEEAHELATYLARAVGNPGPIAYGLRELMVNAVEHGSLELGFQAKRDALKSGNLDAVLQQRSSMPVFSQRKVTVDVERDAERVIYTISDEGPGFDASGFAMMRSLHVKEPNGRGILIAQEMSFDRVEYLGRGNVVRASALLEGRQEF